jgi:hypothetical protein
MPSVNYRVISDVTYMGIVKAMRKNGSPSDGVRRRPGIDANRRLLHDLASTLGALRLRVDLVTKDATCMWAQGSNLEAISRIVDEMRGLTSQLEERAAPVNGRRRSHR